MTEKLSARPFGTRGLYNTDIVARMLARKPFGKRATPPEDHGLEPMAASAEVFDFALAGLDEATLHRRMAMARRHIESFDPRQRDAAKNVMEQLEAELMRR